MRRLASVVGWQISVVGDQLVAVLVLMLGEGLLRLRLRVEWYTSYGPPFRTGLGLAMDRLGGPLVPVGGPPFRTGGGPPFRTTLDRLGGPGFCF